MKVSKVKRREKRVKKELRIHRNKSNKHIPKEPDA